MKPALVSGFKPSGALHVGNYIGALSEAVALQNSGKYSCFYFIADLHSLTEPYLVSEKRREIFEMAADMLAAGIDHKKSTVFFQSRVKEHASLAWIFNSITPVGRLEGMIEYKERVRDGMSANAGLLDYPVLMSADILLYNAKFVPVGEDQRQHLELTRDIVRTFNKKFGRMFEEPKMIIGRTPRVMSLADPGKKMSKSQPDGCIFLGDSPDVIKAKIASAVTDSHNSIVYDPKGRGGISNLILIYSAFSGKSPEAVVNEFEGLSYREFKLALAELISRTFAPIRKKRAYILRHRAHTLRALEKGAKKAEKIARTTMRKVEKLTGLILP